MHVGIWGHYFGGNFGDDMVVRAVIQGIRRRHPDAEITAFAQAPAAATAMHGIPATPIHANYRPDEDPDQPSFWRRHGGWLPLRATRFLVRLAIALLREPVFMLRAYRQLKRIDLLVVAGSGQLQDTYAGPFGMPFTVFKWSVAARLAGTPMAFLGVGVGPDIVTPLGRYFLRTALRLASHVSVRDRGSADLAERLTGERYGTIPDMGFSLDIATAEPLPRRERPVLGLNTMAYADPRIRRDGGSERYETYRGKLAEFAEWGVRSGYDVVLFTSVPGSDTRTGDEVVSLLQPRLSADELNHVRQPSIETPEDFFQVVTGCDFVVSERFHCVVLPTLLERPVMALAYEPKTWYAMEYLGQFDYVLGINDFTVQELIDGVQRLDQNQEKVKHALNERVRDLRRRVEVEFDRVFEGAPERQSGGAPLRRQNERDAADSQLGEGHAGGPRFRADRGIASPTDDRRVRV